LKLTLFNKLNATVSGYPKWYAKYLQDALCRFKWLAVAGIILWAITGYAMTSSNIEDFNAATQYLNAFSDLQIGKNALVWSTLLFGILGCVSLIFFTPNELSINTTKGLIIIVVLVSITVEALHFGLSHLNVIHVISFDLVLLLMFSLAPLSIVWATILILISLGLVLVSSVTTGYNFVYKNMLFLTNPLSYAIAGAVLQRWYLRRFKLEWLISARLQRKTKQLEQQKILIETQKNEVELQKNKIAGQRENLLKVLSSALTEPVAKAYNEQGYFRSHLRTVCVIACDAVGFSETCLKLQPDRVITELEKFFCEFDSACLRYNVEPLRAQGDSRIALSGLWQSEKRELHHEVISAILAMLTFKRSLPSFSVNERLGSDKVLWPARIGINLGSVSCGIIDTSKGALENPLNDDNATHDHLTRGRLWFDVWGETVNVAARLEQGAKENQILVRESVLWETRGLFDYGPISPLKVKSTTLFNVAEIIGIRNGYCDVEGEPNNLFWEVYNAHNVRPYKPNQKGSKEQ